MGYISNFLLPQDELVVVRPCLGVEIVNGVALHLRDPHALLDESGSLSGINAVYLASQCEDGSHEVLKYGDAEGMLKLIESLWRDATVAQPVVERPCEGVVIVNGIALWLDDPNALRDDASGAQIGINFRYVVLYQAKTGEAIAFDHLDE